MSRKRSNVPILLTAAVVFIILGIGVASFIAGFKFNGISGEVVAKTSETIPLVAVDSNGQGTISKLTVDVSPGRGRVLVNINDVLANTDTQQSARNAVLAAENYLGKELDKVDIIFTIESHAQVVAGESAGAAMATALVFALEGKSISDKVAITGTISPHGSIGQISGALAKAQAANDFGATLFLVPKGQSKERTVTPIEECRDSGYFNICEYRYAYEVIDIEEAIGIDVQEVNNLGEALNYF